MSAAPLADPPAPEHGGLMDLVYRRQRHIYDFTRKYYLLGRDARIRALDLKPGESLVEIGCGTARNLIAMARLYPGARLFGLDASQEMLKTAHAELVRAGLEDRVRLVHGLAENLSAAAGGPFDHALFSYSLSMIPDWRLALAAGATVIKGQGLVHIVDFGDFRTLPGRKALLAWLAIFHVTPRTELLAALETELDKTAFNILPGRYAFHLSLTKGQALTFVCCRTVTAGQ